MAALSPITIARFWSKVRVSAGNEECWLWEGARAGNGYGNFRVPDFGSANFQAHRVSFLIVNGRFPPEGTVVRHKCDTPLCVNPYHLDYGTQAQNCQDMVARGRHVPRQQSGELNARARLNAEQVSEIRQLIECGHTNTELGKRYSVSHSTISAIRRGKSWAA